MSTKCCENHNVCKAPPKIRVIDAHHRVGCTVPVGETLLQTLTQPISAGCHTVQFYMGPTNKYECINIKDQDRLKSIEYCDKTGKTFYVHCPNNTNLAREPDNGIFKGTAKIIHKELNHIRGMPGSCIVHIGAIGTIEQVVSNINDLNIPRGLHDRAKKQFILENSAGEGTKLGRSWEELRHLYEGVDKNTVGLCIDTQHIFGAGVNKLQTHEDVVQLFDKAQEVYGKNPDVIHLNDSKIEYGGRGDRHEGLRRGHIWYNNTEGLKSLLNYCYDQDIDVILETPTSGLDLHKIRTKYMDLKIIDTVKIS
jgi:deoxyribonuclease-4